MESNNAIIKIMRFLKEISYPKAFTSAFKFENLKKPKNLFNFFFTADYPLRYTDTRMDF